MTKQEARQRIEKLKETINHHRYLYHVLDRQEISEAALDSLKHELYIIEQQYPEFITPNSPTQRVEGKPLAEFTKIKHSLPMLSIEDVFTEEELKDWENYIKRLEPSVSLEYFTELKIDGFAISLIYKNGTLFTGSTRGDGITGENVTQNLKTIESIPLKLEVRSHKFKISNLVEIRGEVYMNKKDFERFNEEMKKQGKKLYANPRNLAAGSIRQLDSKLTAERPLKFMAYDIIGDFGQINHSKDHKILSSLGFRTDPGKICKNIKEVYDFWKVTEVNREKMPFHIDGVVVNINNNSLFQKLGVAGKSPRGARAFKFSPKQATTSVIDIKIQVGRTGVLTPIAVLKPVVVGGVTISRATLHNEDEIKRLGIKIGDTVIIERAGDVIPAVARVLKELRIGKEKAFRMPRICPVCLSSVARPTGESAWRCINKKCESKKREFLYHFASKKAFNIDGLGPKIIDQLVDSGLISRPPDIFELKDGDLISLERFGEKSSLNIINAVQKSKEISLSRFIYALSILHTGEETAIDLAQYFGSIERLIKASKEEIDKIPNIGPAVSESIFNWFSARENQKLIEDFLKAGIKILAPEKIGRKLEGKTIVITGSLFKITRSEAENKIRMMGGHPASSISKNTDYLVVGENPGSKFEDAKRLGVKTINEKELLEMIG